MKKILFIVILAIFIIFTTIFKNSSTLSIDFDELLKYSNSSFYIKIDKELRTIELYSIKDNDRGVAHGNDEVHHIISDGRINGNDEVCLNSDDIVEMTLCDKKDKVIFYSTTKRCISQEKMKKVHYIKIKNRDENNLVIYYSQHL
jgi:hypothetical protein